MRPFGHCGTTSHGRRKFSPEYNRYYAPLGMHYGRQAADSEMNLHVNRLSGKWRDKVREGLFTRAQWADIFIKAMTEDRCRLLDEANEEDEREQKKEQKKVGRKQQRQQALIMALRTGGRLNAVGVTTTTVTPNTAVTMVDIGGNPVTISFNHMFQKMRDLEAKVEVLLEQTSSNIPNVGCAGGNT